MLERRTIEQILAVLNDFKTFFDQGNSIPRAYRRAVKATAQKYNVRYQTIGDACRRRLGCEMVEGFYKLLQEWVRGEPWGLRDLLLKHASPDDRPAVFDLFKQDDAPQFSHEEGKTMRAIEIDEEIWKALQERARPFEDTPNDVLRRVLLGFPESPSLAPVVYATTLGRPSQQGNSPRDSSTVGQEPRLGNAGHLTTSGNCGLKMKGEEIRGKYLENLRQKGITLIHERGVLYSGANGMKVAIPTATERGRGRRWFLGVAGSYFQDTQGITLILLCTEEEKMFDFVIPPTEVITFMPLLTRADGQVKMNVVEYGENRYMLQVPRGQPKNISQYLHAYGPLRGDLRSA